MKPTSYRPTRPDQFIGPARHQAERLFLKIAGLKKEPTPHWFGLFYGQPGGGKSALADALAMELAGHVMAIETVNGQSVSVDLVRSWRNQESCGTFWSQWVVKRIDELDRASEAAQCELLSLMDRRSSHFAILATSNLTLSGFSKRLQSRFMPYSIALPEAVDVVNLLRRLGVDDAGAWQIANANGGDVRASLNDAEAFLDAQQFTACPA